MFAWLGGAKKRAQLRRKQHAASTAMNASAPIPPPLRPLNNNNIQHQHQDDGQELHIEQQPIKQIQISLRDSLTINNTNSFANNHNTSHHHKSLDLMVMEFPDQYHHTKEQQPSAMMSNVDKE